MSFPPKNRGCQLVDGRLSSRKLIPAILIRDFSYDSLDNVERLWEPARQKLDLDLAARGIFLESRHWNWKRKRRPKYSNEHRLFSIECEGEVQGLMTMETGPRSAILQGHSPLMYVDFIESAPWNLSSLNPIPRFLGVGTVLIGEAVRLSLELGYGGRVGLHALPQAEGFYSNNCRMSRLFVDPKYEDLAYFEYPDGMAIRWLEEMGLHQ